MGLTRNKILNLPHFCHSWVTVTFYAKLPLGMGVSCDFSCSIAKSHSDSHLIIFRYSRPLESKLTKQIVCLDIEISNVEYFIIW